MAAPKKADQDDGIRVIVRNRRAHHDYEIHERLECGIVLTGTEVKSLRERAASLEDAYARVEDGEVWLLGCEIPEYSMGNLQNHKPKRPRKLLMRRREINKFVGKATQRGFTLVPLRLYFKNGLAKVEIALARGKRQYDRREAIKAREVSREVERAIKGSRRDQRA